ncbi:hypothetical protein DFR30_2775 [Thiogranum longum]|uniref:Pectate lyase-like protein n=1 Tax=Thiogranum longum TaxID=1537524 RepID=A0A4R1HBT9_9GAMM|nr:hypothetical protein [Thiogranum longum]TCK19464.1 hypothetical protein DFR30_2775 [Thiogranum longum]
MTQKDIQVGIDPGNQGDGDTLRDAFIKAQSNFDELYKVIPVSDTTLPHDDPSVEGSIAKGLQDAGAAGGGTVLVAPGEYQCISNTLTIPLNVILKGSGRRATTIKCLHPNDGIAMTNSYSGIESLKLAMPNYSNTNGDGIKVTESAIHLRDLLISGGDITTWAINLDGVNLARIENVLLGFLGSTLKPDTLTGNGIIFQNTRQTELPFNYGDSKLSSIDIFLFSNNTTGIKLLGPDDTDLVINNILMSKVEIHGGAVIKAGTTGIHLRNARRNTLLGFDLEGLETGIIEEHGGTGFNVPTNNNYFGAYVLGVTNSYIEAGEVRDRTFIGCDGVTPATIGDAEAVFPRSLWINNGTLQIGQKGGRFQLDDGGSLNGLQLDVSSQTPTIRPTSTDTAAKISMGLQDTTGVECIPGIILPPQNRVAPNPVEGMLIYYNASVVGPQPGLYQYRAGSWVFIA